MVSGPARHAGLAGRPDFFLRGLGRPPPGTSGKLRKRTKSLGAVRDKLISLKPSDHASPLALCFPGIYPLVYRQK